MNIAFIAHDNKRVNGGFCIAYKFILEDHTYMPQQERVPYSDTTG